MCSLACFRTTCAWLRMRLPPAHTHTRTHTALRVSFACALRYAWHTDLADVNARVLLWSPKVPTMRAGQTYDPRGKDWVSVSRL